MISKNKRNVSEIKNDLSNKVYSAVIGLFEELEYQGDIIGNGHHMAQEACDKILKMVDYRLKNK